MVVFSYGSNMSIKRIKERIPNVSKIGIGKIKGYTITFFKKSKDGSGKATIIKAKEDSEVWGVLFSISEKDKKKLDKIEGLGYGYNITNLDVYNENDEIIKAYAYIAEENYINENLKPFDWYFNYVLNGAKENNLPFEYIEFLKLIKNK